MKKIVAICICGIGLAVKGVPSNDVHHKNIETAISQFSVILTNDVRSMDYDFSAILREIKDIRCPHCGSLIDVDSNYCSSCGKEIR